jgi:hypothetical protein
MSWRLWKTSIEGKKKKLVQLYKPQSILKKERKKVFFVVATVKYATKLSIPSCRF